MSDATNAPHLRIAEVVHAHGKVLDVFFKYVRIAMTFENNVQKGLL